jgi:ATP-dependent exoDNAse (exonuclease V) alpha subunit
MNAQALEFKGVDYLKPDIVVIFEDFLEGEFKIKTRGAIMFVKNDLSMDKNYFNGKMGVIKSLSIRKFLFIS